MASTLKDSIKGNASLVNPPPFVVLVPPVVEELSSSSSGPFKISKSSKPAKVRFNSLAFLLVLLSDLLALLALLAVSATDDA